MDALHQLFDTLTRHQEAFREARVSVEERPAENCPGLTYYIVAGRDEGAVQAFLDRKTWEVEDHPHGGYATFKRPFRCGGGWGSAGQVMLYPAEAPAAA